jgi:uncharacterized membrane protein YadS
MTPSRPWLSRALTALAIAVALLGLTVALDQLADAGWTHDGATAWLLALATTAATAGATAAAIGLRTGRHGLAAAGLAVTAVSPNLVVYPLNALLLLAAAVEASTALRGGHRSAHRLPTSASGRPGPSSPCP